MIIRFDGGQQGAVEVPWDYPPQMFPPQGNPRGFGALPCTSCRAPAALAVFAGARRRGFGDAASSAWGLALQSALMTLPGGPVIAGGWDLATDLATYLQSNPSATPTDYVSSVMNDPSLTPDQKTAAIQALTQAAQVAANANPSVGNQFNQALQGFGAGIQNAGQGILAGAEGIAIIAAIGLGIWWLGPMLLSTSRPGR